jgi:hypothetical protein
VGEEFEEEYEECWPGDTGEMRGLIDDRGGSCASFEASIFLRFLL